MAVWHDGGGKDGKRFPDENYQRVGEEFLVNTLTNGFQTKATVATLSDGTFGCLGRWRWELSRADFYTDLQGHNLLVLGSLESPVSLEVLTISSLSLNRKIIKTQEVYSRTGEELVDSVIVTSSGGGGIGYRFSDRYLVAWYDAQDVEGFDIHARWHRELNW